MKGDSEIDDFDVKAVFFEEEDVFWFEVSVSYVLVVAIVDGFN